MRLYVALQTYIYPDLPRFDPRYLKLFVQRSWSIGESKHNVPCGPAVRKLNASKDGRRIVVLGFQVYGYETTRGPPLFRRAAFLLMR